MAPLTPARRPGGRLVRAGLSASWVWPSTHSASNHPADPAIAFTRYPSASRTSGSPRSGFRHGYAGSPYDVAESSSLALRTGRSPPVAPHPASRRRSYLQLQAGERVPEEDFHLSDQTHSQTHVAQRFNAGPPSGRRRRRRLASAPEGRLNRRGAWTSIVPTGLKKGWRRALAPSVETLGYSRMPLRGTGRTAKAPQPVGSLAGCAAKPRERISHLQNTDGTDNVQVISARPSLEHQS